MYALAQDIRFALRSLRGARGTTTIAVFCLALGIGANTAIFSVARAVLLQSLPYSRPGELITINEHSDRVVLGSVSPPLYRDLLAQHRLFTHVAAWTATSRDLGDTRNPERLLGVRATANLFETLGAQALAGRTFAAADAPPNAEPVVVISEGLWERRYGREPSIVGRSIMLGGQRFAVIGVMPASFDFPVGIRRRAFWIPLDFREIGDDANRRNRSLQVVARMTPGIDSARAAVALATLARQLELAYPQSNRGRDFEIHSIAGSMVGTVRPAIVTLLGAVAVVLLIACSNVASLTLVRAAARRREIAIRTALGASRWRLIRQLLTESALVALAGGLLGIAGAAWGVRVLVGLSSTVMPRYDAVTMDALVLSFAVLLSVGTGLLVGILPAARASRPDLRVDLAEAAGRTSASAGRNRTLRLLIVGEIALSVMLLVGAGLMVRSFASLLSVDSGFKPDRVLTFAISAPAPVAADRAPYDRSYAPLLERLRALPGVRAVGATQMLPIQGGMTDRNFQIVGRPVETDPSTSTGAQYRIVTPDYFRAMGIGVVQGRDFASSDASGGLPVAMVNDELARRYFPNESAVGKQVEIIQGQPRTIVGVVRAVREVGLDRGLLPELYVPASQALEPGQVMWFVVSTSGDPALVTAGARAIAAQLAPGLPVFGLTTMKTVIANSVAPRRLLLTLLGLFAILAVVLAAAGVYGVMSHVVGQRNREIGIRIALGARFTDVTGMVMRDVALVTTIGVAVGTGGALLGSRVVAGMLFGVGQFDWISYAIALTVVSVGALSAGAVPAARAARVDALVAMRSEA